MQHRDAQAACKGAHTHQGAKHARQAGKLGERGRRMPPEQHARWKRCREGLPNLLICKDHGLGNHAVDFHLRFGGCRKAATQFQHAGGKQTARLLSSRLLSSVRSTRTYQARRSRSWLCRCGSALRCSTAPPRPYPTDDSAAEIATRGEHPRIGWLLLAIHPTPM